MRIIIKTRANRVVQLAVMLAVLIPLNIKPLIAQEAAQEAEKPRPFRVGTGLGCTFAGYRDEIESPINRYFNALTFLIDGSIEKGKFLHSLNISFFKGNPKMPAPYRGYRHQNYIAVNGLMEYALDYRLWGNKTFPGYLGGAFRTEACYTGTDGKKEDAPIPTGYGLVSLDAHITQKWIINKKNSLVFSMGCPIFGYMIRPPYTGMDELWAKYVYEKPVKILTLGKITSLHNYRAVSGSLSYHYKFTSLFSPYAGLGFKLSHIDFPRQRIDAQFRLNAGFAFTF